MVNHHRKKGKSGLSLGNVEDELFGRANKLPAKVFRRQLRLFGTKWEAKLLQRRHKAELDLKDGKTHTDAVPGAGSKWQKGVRINVLWSLRLEKALWQKSLWLSKIVRVMMNRVHRNDHHHVLWYENITKVAVLGGLPLDSDQSWERMCFSFRFLLQVCWLYNQQARRFVLPRHGRHKAQHLANEGIEILERLKCFVIKLAAIAVEVHKLHLLK